MRNPTAPLHPTWQDKRWLWLLSPAIPLAFTGSLLAFVWTGQWWCMLLAPVIIHVLLPVLDRVLGEDFSNPPESAVAQLEQDVFYRALVWAYLPLQMLGTVVGAWIATAQPLTWWGYAALVFTVGAINGIGIGTAHELGHKKETLDRWLSKIALAPVRMATFLWSTTGATTNAWPLRKTPPAPAWVKAFGPSCRARCGAVCNRPGRWSKSA